MGQLFYIETRQIVAQILYYIAGRVQREQVQTILSGRFDAPYHRRDVVRGPAPDAGGAGSIFARSDRRLALNPAEQDWRPSADGTFWFGWWRDAKPTAEDLLRAETISGDSVNGWLVPRIRKWHLESGDVPYWSETLPQRAEWNGTRFVKAGAVDRFASVAQLASKVHDELWQMYFPAAEDGELVAGTPQILTLPADAPETVGQILAINHAVGMDELGALQAFEMSFQSLAAVLQVFVSYDLFMQLLSEQLEKKTEDVAVA